MVVWLTAFALSQENYATRLGILAQTLPPAWAFLWLRGQHHSWMERGQVRWDFCDTGNQQKENSVCSSHACVRPLVT